MIGADFVSDAGDDDLDQQDIAEAHKRFCEIRGLNPRPPIANFLESIEAKKNGLLTKGGLLFLGKAESIKRFIGDVEFRFSWKEGVKLKRNDVWVSNLWSSINRAKSHFDSCVSEGQFEYGGNAYNVPNLDPDAFHEAFLNAVAHRDYSIDGMISVEFSGSVLQVHSPGSFYGGVNSNNIFFHEPRHRNKALARTLMEYKFVDRAGMGILRMGVKSLIYGRRFPLFEEQRDFIRVSMQAEYIRPGIFVLTHGRSDLHISDLLILNSLYERGSLSVVDTVELIRKTTTNPWAEIDNFIDRWDSFAELCGAKNGIYIRVKDDAKDLFKIEKPFRVPQNSSKYVAVFRYLRKHGSATNEDISNLLEYNHSSTTSRFLGELEWVERSGKSVASKWRLGRKYL